MSEPTPMIKQYLSVKERYPDAILFFRLGDFYEMFYQDAEVASRELDLVLTGRGVEENRMPMCGIPFHAAENYIARLIDKGYKVAICEQLEDPQLAKGVVKRDVIRVVTPGTLIETGLLSDKDNHYLLAVSFDKGEYGLAYCDASTGEFKITQFNDQIKLLDEMNRIAPREILISDMLPDFAPALNISRTIFKDRYDSPAAREKLQDFFGVKNLGAFGVENFPCGWCAAVAIIEYLKETQKGNLSHINHLTAYHCTEFMFIDAATRSNLELVQTIKDKTAKGSLLWVLDKTLTTMGARLLRQWLLQPLLEVEKINLRQAAVEELFKEAVLRAEISRELKQISDLERVVGRIASDHANARDLAGLRETLGKLPKLKTVLAKVQSVLLQQIVGLPDFKEMVDLLTNAIVVDPPLALKEGGIIKPGYSAEMDALKAAASEGKNWVARLEDEERRRTGIKSLKVGFTRVFGYYIEVTKANLEQVPQNYIRKQTLVNCERFITPELKEKEAFILNADERMKEMEYRLFCEIRAKVAEETIPLQKLAQVVSQLDVLLSLAQLAVENRYCRPQFTQDGRLSITASRHPVVEKTIGEYKFVANDILMDDQQARFLLLTGPNMAGKSTYMRQVALSCLLAQIGSFVPAQAAILPVIDRVFTRIGAMDDIFSGQSTFMMEMTETANILHNATRRSLIILDEIGRGTATFDGMSIAAAVAEYIHHKIKAKTLFATHYHEITQLAQKHAGMKNLSVLIKETGDQITFLHKVVEGAADRSYGIQVAKLAGLPQVVVERAKEIYGTLEMVENDFGQISTLENKSETAPVFSRKKRSKTGALLPDQQASLFG